MRFLWIAQLAVFAIASPTLAGESAFPYTAKVTAQQAKVHCGPGIDYYVTTRLKMGDEVEIHRRDADGWLAIRPPKSSYSLVSARHLERMRSGDVAEVVDPHAVSWVASSAKKVGDHRWQVRLDVGERVAIIGEEVRQLYEGGPIETCIRIRPPAGEFRWIRDRDVRHPSQPSTDSAIHESKVQLTDFQVTEREQSPEPAAEKSSSRDGFVARKESPKPEEAPTTKLEPTPEKTVDTPSGAPKMLASGAFDAMFREIDLALSLEVSQPASQWKLAEIREKAEAIAKLGTTTVDRARAQLLIDRIAEFQDVRQRYEMVMSESLAGAPASGDTATGPSAKPRFDGTGWLLPVHSNRKKAPPYALLDGDGRVLQFVSPAPGLNLHRYLKKEIGIYGQKRPTRGLDKPHLTAHRVVDLDRHRR